MTLHVQDAILGHVQRFETKKGFGCRGSTTPAAVAEGHMPAEVGTINERDERRAQIILRTHPLGAGNWCDRDGTRFAVRLRLERYHKEYKQFCAWKRQNAVSERNEKIMRAYLFDLSKKMSSSSLWSKFSMVKPTLQFHENVDISGLSKLRAFVKKQSVGYQPKQAKTLTREDLVKFVKEAPDQQYLLAKVIIVDAYFNIC
ncbi:hypothetical protein Zmor_014470 [Zophobas morio]|uniref:Uncharacterized protein n=1 Tax=Zophobas morio TaxID=2755281 RepID=A0AA38IHH0_9CUCU|nr:hypothetical protein Zmor_014470 [Zophobas morio]